MQPGFFERFGLTVHVGDAVASIDTKAAKVTSRNGLTVDYDALVLATGSYPFVPPLPGNDAPGCFVYRTLDDLEAIRDYAKSVRAGAVVGGGLLGLEAANALKCLGLETHVVEFADRLMPMQVDDAGSSALRRRIEDLGVSIHTGMRTEEIVRDRRGRVRGMHFANEGPDGPIDDLKVGHGRVLGRHPAPGRAGQGGRAADGGAGRRHRRRGLPHVGSQDLRHRRVRPRPRRRHRPAPDLRPGGPRLPHGPGRGRPHPGGRRRVPGRRHVDQAQAPRHRRGQLRRRLRHRPRRRGRHLQRPPGQRLPAPGRGPARPQGPAPGHRRDAGGRRQPLPDPRADGPGRHAHARASRGAHLPRPLPGRAPSPWASAGCPKRPSSARATTSTRAPSAPPSAAAPTPWPT